MARCIACPDDTPCAGRIACGDLPNCDDPTCNQNNYPPPLPNAAFYCNHINANAHYTIRTPSAGKLHILAAEPNRITILEGFQSDNAIHSETTIQIVSATLIDRITYTQPTRDAFYALNRFTVVAPTGDPRNASDGAQQPNRKRTPKNAGGVLTIGTETLD